MSGTMQFRVNRYWANAEQTNVAAFRFFWEFLRFVVDHPNLDFVSYGTGTTVSGTDPTAAWGTWATPPPMADNAWFVFKATLASADLSGSGARPWQAKVQVFNSASGGVGFDDPSGNNYGNEGAFQVVCLRFSPDAGWVAGATRNFTPGSGAAASQNWQIYYGRDQNFGVHFFGDDDTLGAVGWAGTEVQLKEYPRAFSIGETRRSRSTIAKPEFGFFGRISSSETMPGSGTYYNSRVARGTVSYPAFVENGVIYNPSFSLGSNGTTAVEGEQAHTNFGYGIGFIRNLPVDPWNTKNVLSEIMLGQASLSNWSNIGTLRLFKFCPGHWTLGTMVLDGAWLQVANSSHASGGIVIPWPSGTVPAW